MLTIHCQRHTGGELKKRPVFGLVFFIFSLKVNQKVDIVSVVCVACIISVEIYGVLLNKC